jgi:RNA polymerase subunit RPABC4/transcription elongation factor Spt4
MPFCKRCGALADDAARFCDACGEPFVKASTKAEIIAPVTHSEPIAVAKIIKIAGVSMGVLAILAGAAWFFTKADSPPDPSALSTMLDADQTAIDQRVCLDNLPYDKDKISVSGYDNNTKQWLDSLVTAGLYSTPEKVESGGWYSQISYLYQQTPIGLKAVRNGKLCFANGIVVDTVNYTEPQKINDTSLIKGHYSYHYNMPEKWVSLPALMKLASDKLGKTQFEDDVLLLSAQGKWRIATAVDRQTMRELANIDAAKQQISIPVANSGGLLGWFKDLFSGLGSNPLIGKWQSQESGEAVEFTPTDMIEGRRVLPVVFKMQDKTVVVSVAGQPPITFVIIDANHVLMDSGFFKLSLTRVN